MTYFIADPHHGHNREFIYKDRGFLSIPEHDQKLLNNCSQLDIEDTLYILGDVSCGKNSLENSIEFLSQLKCKVCVIKGNHDEELFQHRRKLPFIIHFIDSVYLDIKVEGQKITLCHYPMISWNASHHGSWLLYGHVHNKQIPLNGKMLDVAPTKEHMYPYSFNEIKEIMETKPDNWDFIQK